MNQTELLQQTETGRIDCCECKTAPATTMFMISSLEEYGEITFERTEEYFPVCDSCQESVGKTLQDTK